MNSAKQAVKASTETKVGNVIVKDPADYESIKETIIVDSTDILQPLDKILRDNGLEGLLGFIVWWDKKEKLAKGLIILDAKNCPYLPMAKTTNDNVIAKRIVQEFDPGMYADTKAIREVIDGAFIHPDIPTPPNLVIPFFDSYAVEVDLELAMNTLYGFNGENKYLKLISASPRNQGGNLKGVNLFCEVINSKKIGELELANEYINPSSRELSAKHIVRAQHR